MTMDASSVPTKLARARSIRPKKNVRPPKPQTNSATNTAGKIYHLF